MAGGWRLQSFFQYNFQYMELEDATDDFQELTINELFEDDR